MDIQWNVFETILRWAALFVCRGRWQRDSKFWLHFSQRGMHFWFSRRVRWARELMWSWNLFVLLHLILQSLQKRLRRGWIVLRDFKFCLAILSARTAAFFFERRWPLRLGGGDVWRRGIRYDVVKYGTEIPIPGSVTSTFVPPILRYISTVSATETLGATRTSVVTKSVTILQSR